MSQFIINKTIRVAYHFSDRSSQEADESISFQLFYPVDNYIPLATGVLEGDNRKEIHCSAVDGFTIKGSLASALTREEMVLLGNLFYGPNNNPALQNHFEGTIAIFPVLHPVPPPPPEPAGRTDDFPGDISLDAPLFPYIYVQPWPKETVADDRGNFFCYDTSNSPAGCLYQQLAALAAASDRAGMNALVISFLQNEAPFSGQYFERLNKVPPPFDQFAAIYNRLTDDETWNHDDYAAFGKQLDYSAIKDQLWQNYFALLIITGFNEQLFLDLNKILVICNLIEVYSRNESIQQLLRASIILPETVFPLPAYSGSKTGTNDSWIEPYAIGELKMAKYRLLRYQPGEIARIQNVLKGEKKKIIHRTMTTTVEQSVQHHSDSHDNSNESQQVTNELLVETKKTVAELTKELHYDNLKTTYGPPTQGILNGFYTKKITAGKPADKNRNHFATRVLNKTLNRINESVVKARAHSSSRENEEISYSLFDNQSGATHFRGVYRWVNKIYRISVENYGYRFLLEFCLDNPAEKFKEEQETINNINLRRPLSPAQKKITGFNDIKTDNYMELVNYYQLTSPPLPPEAVVSVSATLNAAETEKYISIPEGYIATDAVVTGHIAKDATLTEIRGILGTVSFFLDNTNDSKKISLNNETSQVVIAVTGVNLPVNPPAQVSEFIVTATIYCKAKDKKVDEWKIVLYREITEAYERMMMAYNDHITRFAPSGIENNPLLLNNIEKSALHHGCLNLLLAIIAVKVGDPPALHPSMNSVNRQRYIQFLEEAFEWDEMTYHFNDQPSRLSYALQGRDDSLRPFLQATTAIVFLPVRPEYNFQVLYYLSSGVICPSPYPFVPVNNATANIAIHLKKIVHGDEQRRMEKYWEITLPTAMQVIEENSHLPDILIHQP